MVRHAAALLLAGVLLFGFGAARADTCGATVVEVGSIYVVHDQRDPLAGHMSEWIYQENGLAPGLQRHDISCFTLDPAADLMIGAFVGPF